jgi:hypothetical protein
MRRVCSPDNIKRSLQCTRRCTNIGVLRTPGYSRGAFAIGEFIDGEEGGKPVVVFEAT